MGLRCALLGLPAGLVVQTWPSKAGARVQSLARELLSHKPGAGWWRPEAETARTCLCLSAPLLPLEPSPWPDPPCRPACPHLLLHWDICPD